MFEKDISINCQIQYRLILNKNLGLETKMHFILQENMFDLKQTHTFHLIQDYWFNKSTKQKIIGHKKTSALIADV